MCGIVGICEADPLGRVDEDLLRRATRRLIHRGPDGEGYLVKRNVGLGHRRLSIIDLQTGDQPIYSEDGSIGVVLNGEIYNYRELRTTLERLGHVFRTESDTEVIVHAYEQYGSGCLEHFMGMCALAVWDGRDQSVFIARDRLGKKPLFYHLRDGRLVFASELKAILEDPAVPRELNIGAVDDYLTYTCVPTDRSIFTGIEKLPPGHWMRWKNGRVSMTQYWDVDFRVDETVSDEQEWAERVEAVLREAVRLRLRADVPLGIFLSGGIDSSAVVALASQELGAPVKTFSVGFDEPDFDELRYARLMAGRYHTDHHEITVRDDDISVLSDLAYYLDEPFGDPSSLPTYYICREARRHVTVCLSGDGGDETFAGYTRYREGRLRRCLDGVPLRPRQVLSTLLLTVMPQTLWGRGMVERFGYDRLGRYQAEMSEFTLADRRTLLAGHGADVASRTARCFERQFAEANGRDEVSLRQHVDQKNYLPDDILVKVDRMSMRNSLEVRVPLLDHHVVELVNSMPVNLKMRNNSGKYLLKRLLAPHVPSETLGRRKMGFGIPIKHWFRNELQPYAMDLLLSPNSRCTRYLARDAIADIIRGHGMGMRDFSRKIWSLLMFEHWCRAFNV